MTSKEDNKRLAIRDWMGALRSHIRDIEESAYLASRVLAKLEEVLKEAEG